MHVVSIIEAIKKSSNTNSIVYLQT
jgi:hypothetical protein